jgi:hypothetical protein
VAIASRGGNDLNNESTDEEYRSNLVTLIKLLMNGSSCHAVQDPPVVVVVAHLPDRTDVAAQDRVFGKVTREAFEQVRRDGSLPQAQRNRLQFADVYGAFKENRATRAFPRPHWYSGSAFDMTTIGQVGDVAHPRRLASIYAGEIVADSLDLAVLKGLAGR